ncbi:MAG: rhombosortase [Gammaproteobacteria bacterium]|nr:MAG: rhombosortase [Gammaproteobacteria bacterium]
MNRMIVRQVRGSISLPRMTLLFSVLALVLAWLTGFASPALVLDLQSQQGLSWWRWFTAHWVHSDVEHLVWNVLALFILGILFENRLKGFYFTVIILSSLMIDVWFVLINPYYSAYCGLSGVLNAIMASGLVVYWKKSRDMVVPLILLAVVIKISVEWLIGGALFTQTTWAAVPQAHLIGLTVGVFVGMFAKTPDSQYKKGFAVIMSTGKTVS